MSHNLDFNFPSPHFLTNTNIFNVYITLVDSKVIDGDIIGKIAFIGKELGDESDRVVEENDNICAIYHDSAEIEGEVTYDE